MGGGTGTGGAPVVAEVARELGILTVAVVTKPFPFEGKKRMAIAEEGLRALHEHVDSLITIPNERLLPVLGKSTSLLDAFKAANDVLLGAVQGIADLIIHPGIINVDFADVRTVMSEMGMAMMGTGRANGEGRASEAAEAAINSPLLDDINLNGARGILVNITAGRDLGLGEFADVGHTVEEIASPDATVVIGTAIDDTLGDEVRVTIVATGLGDQPMESAPVKLVESSPRVNSADHYSELDRPTVMRRGKKTAEAMPEQVAAGARGSKRDSEMEYLDIPAFLRRQAD
jgi:cell division protein FtsZ